MPIISRSKAKLPNPGPWLGIVTSHQDPTYMGSLEVVLIKPTTGEINLQSETFVVNYLSPFYGVSSVKLEGNDSSNFQDVQKSYGFWAVPPDIGATVMCIFIDGDPNQGYWFGCVQDRFQNHMVPGLAASPNVAITAEQERKYGTRNLPVAEFLKGTRDVSIGKPDTFTKPIHPFADRLLAQGLLIDSVRGTTTSSARREVPSQVFGISTPGPLDPNGRKATIGYETKTRQPITRLGGSSFVMDDGDENGQNELVRIRTRTGHQILLHNTHDLIYIAHGSGKSWIEMTGNGKIDIYAKDSISVHTEADFNFRADRDINFEAGRNLNISVGANMQTDVGGNYTLIVDNNGKILFSNDLNETVGKNSTVSIGSNFNLGAGGSIFQSANSKMHLYAASDMFQQSSSNFNIKAGEQMFQQSGADFNVNATGNYIETASRIDMNGPLAAEATKATVSSIAEVPTALPKFKLPNRSKEEGWDDKKFYKAEDLTSIMKRVPTHEPWDQHESINQTQFTSVATDTGTPAPSTFSTSSPATTPNWEKSETQMVIELQKRLIAAGAKIVADGKFGPKTQAAMKQFPQAVGDYVTSALRMNPKVPLDWTADIPFVQKVIEVAKELNCSFIDLLCCISFETGRTMSPSIRNSIGATGLIQFIPDTAVDLGTTTNKLAAMTRVEQMDWVLKYFKKGPIRKISNPTLEDLYMQILWPRAVGKPLEYVLFSSPSIKYVQNNGLDANMDGNITKDEVAAKVRNQLSYIRTQLLKVPEEAGIWTDADGNPITDSSGNPIRGGYYPPKSN